jgi:hypothetical protein
MEKMGWNWAGDNFHDNTWWSIIYRNVDGDGIPLTHKLRKLEEKYSRQARTFKKSEPISMSYPKVN